MRAKAALPAKATGRARDPRTSAERARRARGRRGAMQLFLRTVSGVCVPLQCAADETVRALKERIQEREGIPVEEQVLLCRGA